MSELKTEHLANSEELQQIVAQLQSEEVQADDARISSEESFQLWVMTHPVLRQMHIVESLSQLAPAILAFVRSMLGL